MCLTEALHETTLVVCVMCGRKYVSMHVTERVIVSTITPRAVDMTNTQGPHMGGGAKGSICPGAALVEGWHF